MIYYNIIIDKEVYYQRVETHECIIQNLLSRVEDFDNSIYENYDKRKDKYDIASILEEVTNLSFQFSVHNVELINFIIFSENIELKNELTEKCQELHLTLKFCSDLIKKQSYHYPVYN